MSSSLSPLLFLYLSLGSFSIPLHPLPQSLLPSPSGSIYPFLLLFFPFSFPLSLPSSFSFPLSLFSFPLSLLSPLLLPFIPSFSPSPFLYPFSPSLFFKLLPFLLLSFPLSPLQSLHLLFHHSFLPPALPSSLFPPPPPPFLPRSLPSLPPSIKFFLSPLVGSTVSMRSFGQKKRENSFSITC